MCRKCENHPPVTFAFHECRYNPDHQPTCVHTLCPVTGSYLCPKQCSKPCVYNIDPHARPRCEPQPSWGQSHIMKSLGRLCDNNFQLIAKRTSTGLWVHTLPWGRTVLRYQNDEHRAECLKEHKLWHDSMKEQGVDVSSDPLPRQTTAGPSLDLNANLPAEQFAFEQLDTVGSPLASNSNLPAETDFSQQPASLEPSDLSNDPLFSNTVYPIPDPNADVLAGPTPVQQLCALQKPQDLNANQLAGPSHFQQPNMVGNPYDNYMDMMFGPPSNFAPNLHPGANPLPGIPNTTHQSAARQPRQSAPKGHSRGINRKANYAANQGNGINASGLHRVFEGGR